MAEVYALLDVLEGPEVEIGPDDEDDIDLVFSYREGAVDPCRPTHILLTMSGSENIQEPTLGAEPDNDIYEVDQILDGPRKRREHNYQKCYKIRWKNFGKEADSWQPTSDLENVMYMVREFNRKRAEQQRKNGKKKEQMKAEEEVTLVAENNNIPKSTQLEVVGNTGEKEESEVFGSLKDRFWKKLEMGLYDKTVFEGDMYSKVKGSRRAAHADAATNIQKMQQQEQTSPTDDSKAASRSTIRFKQKHRRKAEKSSPSTNETNSVRPLHLGSPKRGKRRSSDPFSARGYMSAKRSRRSREQKRPSVSSVTLGIVSLPQTDSELPNGHTEEDAKQPFVEVESAVTAASQDESDQAGKPPFNTLDSGYHDETEDVPMVENEAKMTITSETVLTVTNETVGLDRGDVIHPEEIVKLKSDENFLQDSRVNGLEQNLASAAAGGQAQFSAASGATDSLNGEPTQRSMLDTQSEATGAVERSHSEECLWGGACNRADCKSNRRWNMKNGKGNNNNNAEVSSSSSSSAQEESSAGNSISTDSNPVAGRNIASTCPPPPNSNLGAEPQQSNSLPSHRTSSPVSHSSKTKSNPSSHASSRSKESLVSSLPNTDSTSGQTTSSRLRRNIAGAFGHMDMLSQGMQRRDDVAGSSSSREHSRRPASSRSATQTSEGAVSCGVSGSDRPGVFSGNGSFCFGGENSLASQSSSMPQNPSNPPSSGSSMNLSSPGKENFSNRSGAKVDFTNVGSSVQDQFHLSSVVTDSEFRQEPVSSSSERPNEMMDFGSSDGWSQRKRGGESSLPLEKIPSPNLRRDLDQRVLTTTCEELEDMEIQGEDHKDRTFVTNADLLQAVNLNKGEVVRRAIKQSSETNPKLDFEQPDSNGLTLLMRAVNKSSIAIVEMLIENGADVNAQQSNGTTPLMMAVEQREVCVVALLLKYGANSSLCTVGSESETALIKAIRRQNKDAVSLMLRTGVNFSSPDCANVSALDVAVERRNTQIEAIVRSHIERTVSAFEEKVFETLQDTAQIMGKLFPVQCFPLRESHDFTVSFNSHLRPLSTGEGFLLFIAHTKMTEKGVKCRFHGSCPIASVTVNGVVQSPLTKEVNFVTSCHPVVLGCNTLVITKHADYLSKAKLLVCAYRARLLSQR